MTVGSTKRAKPGLPVFFSVSVRKHRPSKRRERIATCSSVLALQFFWRLRPKSVDDYELGKALFRLSQPGGFGDILFVDSSHVVKAGSDCQLLFSDILPRLNPGTLIHFHDVFERFDYPSE